MVLLSVMVVNYLSQIKSSYQIKYYSIQYKLQTYNKMKENNKSNNHYHLKPLFHKIRIAILLLPFLTIYSPLAEIIYENCSVFINLVLLILIYVGHQHHFHNFILDQSRKFLVSLLISIMISALIVQVQQIYDAQIVFWFRVIIVLSNLQGNIQLFEHPHRNKHKSHHQKTNLNEQNKKNMEFNFNNKQLKKMQKNQVLIQQNQEMSRLSSDF